MYRQYRVRALIIDLDRGVRTACSGTDYPCGTRGVCLKEGELRPARQSRLLSPAPVRGPCRLHFRLDFFELMC